MTEALAPILCALICFADFHSYVVSHITRCVTPESAATLFLQKTGTHQYVSHRQNHAGARS